MAGGRVRNCFGRLLFPMIGLPPMRHLVLALSLAAFAGGLGCSSLPLDRARPPSPWPHEVSDLKPDPQIVWGRLENGLRYAILPHATPSGRASVNLLIEVGSYQETDRELGYAHFVEHMVLRGSTSFPGDTAIEALQRLGIQYGPDANAQTSIFDTDYFFNDLPLDNPTALPESLNILRSIADGAMFDPKAVGKERGVILSEARDRAGAMANLWRDPSALSGEMDPRWIEVRALYPNERITRRPPIGTEPMVEAATAATLRGFYGRWYRADRMIVTVCGDFAPLDVEALIRRTFGGMAKPGRSPREPAGVRVPARQDEPFVSVQERRSEPLTSLTLCAARPTSGPDTAERRRRELAASVALGLLGQRLEHDAQSADATFAMADSFASGRLPGQDIAMVRVSGRPEQWPTALATLDMELRRALRDGFTPTEFIRARTRAVAHAESEIAGAGAQSSASLAKGLAFSIAHGVVATSPDTDYALAKRELAALTPEACRVALDELLPAGGVEVALFGPFSKTLTDREVVDTLARSRKAPLVPYVDFAPKDFPYRELGPAGAVVADAHDAGLDAELVRFANGVRLDLKPTKFEAHRAYVTVLFGGGQLAGPPDKPGLTAYFSSWILSGVGDLSMEQEWAAVPECDDWNLTPGLSSTKFSIRAEGPSGGLERMIEDMAAHFAHPAVRPEGWARSIEYARKMLAPAEHTSSGVAENTLLAARTGDPSLALPSIQDVIHRTPEEFIPWFRAQLAAGPIEVGVVGDFDPVAVRETVARTFGALPKLNGGDDPFFDRRRIKYPATPFSETKAFSGSEAVATAKLSWPALDVTSAEERYRGVIVAQVLQDRLRLQLRAKLGKTYAPSVRFGWSDEYTPSPAGLMAAINVAPDEVVDVATLARLDAEILGLSGATTEEFERAREPLVRGEEFNRRSNEWWRGVVETAQGWPNASHEALQALDVYRHATVGEINALARRILRVGIASEVLAVPADRPADGYNQVASQREDRGDWAGARREIGRALAADPNSAEAFRLWAKAKAEQNDLSGALADLQRAIALQPDFALAFVDRSGVRFDQRDYAGALADDERVVALEPKWPDGYNNRGAAKEELNDLEGAMADYTLALRLNPKSALAYANRADVDHKLGKLAAAIKDYGRAITLDPTNESLYRRRATVRQARGDVTGAEADFAKANSFPQTAPGNSGGAAAQK